MSHFLLEISLFRLCYRKSLSSEIESLAVYIKKGFFSLEDLNLYTSSELVVGSTSGRLVSNSSCTLDQMCSRDQLGF